MAKITSLKRKGKDYVCDVYALKNSTFSSIPIGTYVHEFEMFPSDNDFLTAYAKEHVVGDYYISTKTKVFEKVINLTALFLCAENEETGNIVFVNNIRQIN